MTTEEIRIDTGDGSLVGTFTTAPEPIAAALLIPGSGRTDRDSDARLPFGQVLRIGMTRQLAEALAAAGLDSLRYDKRGVGASGGDFYRIGMDLRLTEARAALEFLAARAPSLPLLVIGASEGTYYAAQLAAADPRVAGIVLLSGSARRGEQVLAWQTAQIAARLPAATKFILRLLRIDVVRAQRKNMARVLASSADVMRIQGTKLNARWLRDFAASDPAPALARVTVPVLAITGGHDLQVPPDDVAAVGKLVQGPFEGHVLPDLSHLLRPDPDWTGPRGYKRAVRQPVSPDVLALITGWAARHWGAQATTSLERQ
ncbi:MAG TPA: alpha/beta hydrolase [Streptosporangiaceae bacterium]|jgi:hypothetical protein